MKRTLLVSLLVIASSLVGCLGQSAGELDMPGSRGTQTPPVNGTPPAGLTPPAQDSDAGVPPPPPAATDGDLPCEVIAALQSCSSCHGATLAGGAPIHLVTYKDLAAPSPYGASVLVIDRAIARMSDAQRPMPPSGQPPQSDIDALKNWRAAGMPSIKCTSMDPPPPQPTPTVCSSGTYWSSGNHGSSKMNPGLACISCHSRDEGPGFAAAGTLYPTLHEPDRCNGADGTADYAGASVEIIDANGKSFVMSVNSAGNFYLNSGSTSIKLPIRATVHYQGKTRSMVTAQNSADCNSCHTEQGTNGAPGRVALP